MRVVVTTPGVFHHFALARQLEGRGHLACIFTAFPWLRVQREGVPRSLVHTFPVLKPLEILLERQIALPPRLGHLLEAAMEDSFDWYCAKRLPPCDVVIAASGSGLRTGLRAQAQGALYICDRGSSHCRYQATVLAEEYARWGARVDPLPAADLALEEAEYSAADCILVPSAFSYRTFVERGVSPAKLRKLPLAADLNQFFPEGRPDPEAFTVVFVGHVSFRKGLPYLLEAFSRVQHPRKRLRLVGHIENRIRPYLQTAPLDKVTFEGAKPAHEVRAILSAADVLVLPSVEDGFGMVMAEAMACGTPVIASDHTGASELFEDGVEGLIVPPGDTGRLCAALQSLAEDAELRQQMRTQAYARMRGKGGWVRYGDAVEALLRGMLHGPRPLQEERGPERPAANLYENQDSRDRDRRTGAAPETDTSNDLSAAALTGKRSNNQVAAKVNAPGPRL